jgi:cytochrome c553
MTGRLALLATLALLLAAAPRPDLAWLYPQPNGPAPPLPPGPTVSLAGSGITLNVTALRDRANAVVWYPDRYAGAPAIIFKSGVPDHYACGFCHLPGGEGRPENASLAGLPAAYIIAQAQAFRAGQRASVQPGWVPTEAMTRTAGHYSDAEVEAAAQWFSRQRFVSRVKVVESATVPATSPLGFILTATDGPRQPIAGRIIEIPDNPEHFELRDPDASFTAFVPPGSIARGAAIGQRLGCRDCHAEMLGGWGPGRSPSYILRQLLAFRTGARADANATPMREVAAQLSEAELVDAAAWLASLPVER